VGAHLIAVRLLGVAAPFPVSSLSGNGKRVLRRIRVAHSRGVNEIVEEPMRILVSLSGMLRLVVLCFVLGVALGLYRGIGGGPAVTPPPIDTTSQVDELAAP
jgi:hypothetical protein